ncbi:MAG: hypothetical protein ACYTG4_13605, partial [Planctomycetota bacterium]
MIIEQVEIHGGLATVLQRREERIRILHVQDPVEDLPRVLREPLRQFRLPRLAGLLRVGVIDLPRGAGVLARQVLRVLAGARPCGRDDEQQ